MVALLAGLQASIEALYRLDPVEPISEFYMSEEHLALLGDDERAGIGREALLVDQVGATTSWVGVFVAKEIREQAEAFAAGKAPELFDAFSVVAEGVSHFVYFMHCGGAQDRPVSRIELELQAEVDKYLLALMIEPKADWVSTLFEQIRFDARLSGEEHERYWVANDRARRYAKWIERRKKSGALEAAIEDARKLYRKPFTEKLAHIAAAA